MNLLLVGLDNPQSSDPRYALFPYPPGCTGHRLSEMMTEVDDTITLRRYNNIPKTNLFPTGSCPRVGKSEALRVAGAMLVEQMHGSGKFVVLMGNDVRDAVMQFRNVGSLPKMMKMIDIRGTNYAWIPHPSGRNHFYNEARSRKRIARFLVGLLVQAEADKEKTNDRISRER